MGQESDPHGCQPLITACRAAIKAHDKEVADANTALQEQIEATSVANKRLSEADSQLASWTRNPFFVGALGFAVGALVTGYAIKH